MRNFFVQSLSTFNLKFFGPVLRSVGKKLYISGTKIQGQNASQDRIVPSLRNLTYHEARPNLQEAQFIAPNATILGNVSIGVNSSVWYAATLIGTKGIKIGNESIIQDRCHLSSEVNIGNNVFVGPNTIIQGSELADNSFISMGATVRHAKVESGGLVAAGAVIPDGAVVKQGQVWAGNPGKFLRNITPIEREILRQHVEQMRDLASIHQQFAQRNSRQVISNLSEPFERYVYENYIAEMQDQPNYEMKIPFSSTDEQFVERRTFMRQTITPLDQRTDYQPYQHNLQYMGQKFNLGVHNEEYYKMATKIQNKERFDTDQDPWTKPY